MRVETNEVSIDVVQKRVLRSERQWYSKSATESFDKPSLAMSFPEGSQMRRQPTFSAGPLERGLESKLSLDWFIAIDDRACSKLHQHC